MKQRVGAGTMCFYQNLLRPYFILGKWEGDIDALYSKVYPERQRCPDVLLIDGRK